jgi:multiple sugar transport system ATP-binding protein
VNDLNLEIKDREFMVLVGPSGCGKTTALRMIAGLEVQSDGDIHIGDKCVNNASPGDRDIAMVFQNYALYPHMSVRDNMSFALKLRNLDKKEIDRRVEDAANLLGLKPMLQRRPAQLSGGQRQRVALGRAIVREPEVFLMDEPLSNLDARLRVQTRAELIKLHRRLGITTIYVTHDQVEAMTMGDRIAVMSGGVLQQCDTPMDIYNQPTNMFVAGFIGTPSMNFLKGTIVESDGRFAVDCGSFTLPVRESLQTRLGDWIGQAIVLGIRPSDIYPSGSTHFQGKSASQPLTTLLDVSEPMGDTATLYLTIGNQSLVATVNSEISIKDGQSLDMVIDLEKTHLFDPETEKAIY